MSGSGANKLGSRIATKAVDFSAPVIATQERDALLRAKQTELDQIFNRHDDLVRSVYNFPPLHKLTTVCIGQGEVSS